MNTCHDGGLECRGLNSHMQTICFLRQKQCKLVNGDGLKHCDNGKLFHLIGSNDNRGFCGDWESPFIFVN